MLSTETARSRSSPPVCAHPLDLTSCQARRGYDKLERRPHHFIRSHIVRESTPIPRTFTFTAPMSTPMRSSFQSSTNSSFQNYARRLPAVRMARMKQTARKVRDDQQRGRSHQPERDWRHDRSNTPPRRARLRSPSPERLECIFCGQISFQRRNHRRHLITKHNCRPDGTPATAADIEEARRGDSMQLTGRNTRYKSREFVETDSDDDTTPMESGMSTPSERRSPSPPRGSRQKRTRSESSASPSPQRDTRHVMPRPPSASSSTVSRAVSPPQAAPPRRKQVRKVRFERGKTFVPEEESGTTIQKKPVKPSAAKTTRQTAASRKNITAKPEQRPTTETETQATSSAAACAKELLVSTPKIDAMTEIAKQAVANLNKREVGVKFKEPLPKPEKEKPLPPKRHQHPLPSKGKSAYVGKGKATAPAKKPLEIITISAQDVLASLLPKVTSPSHSTATSILKPINTTAETITKPEVPIEEVQNKENETCELPPTTDVTADLELSQDSEAEEIHGVHIIDLDADLDAQKPSIEFSDVEPDYTAEELAPCAHASIAPATTTPTLPKILFDFHETAVISDDEGVSTTAPSKLSTTSLADVASLTTSTDVVTTATSTVFAATSKCKEATTTPVTVSVPTATSTVIIVSSTTTTVTPMTLTVPTTSVAAAPEPSTSKTVVTSSKSPTTGRRPIAVVVSDDFPTRRPCQPKKPYNTAQKIKIPVPEPEPLPRQTEAVPRPPEATPQVQRHLKIIDHKKLATATLDYNISTDEISRGFAQKYALREGDRYALRKDLRKMRLAQKVLLLKMRAKFPVNCNTKNRRQEYLDYFEQESLRTVSRQSDSDDDFDIGKAV